MVTSPTLFRLIYVIFLVSVSSMVSLKSRTLNSLVLDTETHVTIPRLSSKQFCYKRGSDYTFLAVIRSLFSRITIGVSVVQSTDELDFYSVRGVSSDDFQLHMKTAGSHLLSLFLNQSLITNTGRLLTDVPEIEQSSSLFRDILSSCPSPFGYSSRHQCDLTFSTLGNICIQVSGRKSSDLRIVVQPKRKIKIEYVTLLLAGIMLLYFADPLSSSILFQYASGSLFFLLGGVLLAVLFIIHRNSKAKSAFGAVALLGILGSGYIASAFWIVSSRLQFWLTSNPEVIAIYVIAMTFTGLLVARLLRGYETSRHSFRITVKWTLRFIALLILYNSTSSPLMSLCFLVAMLTAYLIYSALKLQ